MNLVALHLYATMMLLGTEMTLALTDLEMTSDEAMGLRRRLFRCAKLFGPQAPR